MNKFLENLLNNLSKGQKEQILREDESRLDENLDFFIRLDKDSWINDKKLELTDSGKCFHLKISIAAFPKKREVALKVVICRVVSGERLSRNIGAIETDFEV